MSDPLALMTYAVPAAAIVAAYGYVQNRFQRQSAAVRDAAREAGLTEPPAIHPVIDPTKCIGCKA